MFFLFFYCKGAYSQSHSVLINGSTNEVIPYASIYIKNSKTGTSSDLNGKFSIYINFEDTLIISSVGFKHLELSVKEIEDTLRMEYDIQKMSEIIVSPKKARREWFPKRNILGDLESSFFKGKVWVNSGGNAFQIARLFEYKSHYRTTPYIHRIVFNASSKVDNAVYSVKLYKANKEGYPGELINSETIIGNVRKGTHKSVLDLKNQNIRFPNEGLFVAVDYINIESNRSLKDSDYSFLHEDYKYDYSPSIKLKPSSGKELYQFDYEIGKWYISQNFREVIECEIVLTE